MKKSFNRKLALEKLAYGLSPSWPTVGIYNPPPSVGDVLNAIGVAQARGIGTQSQRTDAFGRIVDSGLEDTSPAGRALMMLGGGILGRAITGAFTKNPFFRGLGAGFGAMSSINKSQ